MKAPAWISRCVGTLRRASLQGVGCFVGVTGLACTAHAAETHRWAADTSFWNATHFLEIRYDADHSGWLQSAREGGFETSDGRWVSFRPWYGKSGLRNTSIAWMTQLSSSWGVIWGFGTGERGIKYTIDPSLKIGAVYRAEISRQTAFSLKATTILGGRLREKTCIGDYSDLGGAQVVNCRLAASPLAPAETLKYSFNEKPLHHRQLMLQFNQQF